VTNAIGVSAGEAHSCARLSTGQAICWGDNVEGTLGDGSGISTSTPINVSVVGSDARRVSAGPSHTCATRASDGEVMCWGRANEGQIGDNGTTQRNAPTSTTPSLKQAYDISARGNHTCAWMGACSAKCWGDNAYGQLGNGTTTSSLAPVSITFCSAGDPTPTPTFTPTPLPDACGSEETCVPDSRLTTPTRSETATN
jgi:alpha-tubulin suppressor-like RCC1 family protein